jgi:hypothetical protein
MVKSENATVVVPMVVEKECKSCIRFKAADSQAAKLITTVYVNNAALEQLGNPEKINVTVTVAK